jgi:hypothetical protein
MLLIACVRISLALACAFAACAGGLASGKRGRAFPLRIAGRQNGAVQRFGAVAALLQPRRQFREILPESAGELWIGGADRNA